MIDGYKEHNIIWMNYRDVHESALLLAKSILETTDKVILVPVARGGWAPARLIAAYFEERGVPSESFSISVTYQNIGTADERVVLTQGLDSIALESIARLYKQGYKIWVIEGVCHTGRALKAVKDYLVDIVGNKINDTITVSTAALHLTEYNESPEAPWRLKKALRPDIYGELVTQQTKPHIEYPWEHSDIVTKNKE